MLRMTVESITACTTYPEFEIVIVDDGSTDGSCDVYRAGTAGDRTRVVDGGGGGIPRARNLGEEHASGAYVVFLDAHCRVSANWLDLFAEALRRRDTAIVGPTFTRLEQAEPKGCGMTWLNHKLEKTWFVPLPTDKPYEVPITPGGCQAFRRDTFRTIGRFDEGFTKFGFQDVEICLRAWLLGYRVLVNPAVEIAHHFRTERNYQVVGGERFWMFDRQTGKLASCINRLTSNVGERELECNFGTLSRYRRTFGNNFTH